MNTTRFVMCFAVIAAMALAGCGGGGGGGGSMIGMTETPTPTPETPTPTPETPTPTPETPTPTPDVSSMPSVSVFGDLNATQEVADNIVTAIGKAASAMPRAGSVTQSSNVDSGGITTDQVEVTAEYGASGPSFEVRNGTEWSIGMDEGNPSPLSDTTGAALSKGVNGGTVYVEAYTDIEAPTTIPGQGGTPVTLRDDPVGTRYQWVNLNNRMRSPGTRNGVDGIFSCSGTCPSFGGNVVNWSGTNWIFTPTSTTQTQQTDTDYLSGGVWLVVPDNATSADDYVFGAFVDGSDPFDQTNLVTLQGSATYEGGATGVYSEKTAESTSIGYFEGAVELTANFGGGNDLGTISGSITNFEVDGEPDVGMLSLGTAPIGSQDSGFFEGAVTGADDERTYVGNWGGQFFGNGESDGRPGSVGGTFGGSSTDDEVNFVGVFGAHKE